MQNAAIVAALVHPHAWLLLKHSDARVGKALSYDRRRWERKQEISDVVRFDNEDLSYVSEAQGTLWPHRQYPGFDILNTASVTTPEKVRETWPQKAPVDMLSQGMRRQHQLPYFYEVLCQRKSNRIHT